MGCESSALEKLVTSAMLERLSAFKGKRILITGHTGFKGTWLSRTLVLAGAEVFGIALAPEVGSIFSRLNDLGIQNSTILDIRDRNEVNKYFQDKKFDGVFHLAAQPLVLKSYDEPVETFETNVMGTAHLLDSIITNEAAEWILVITTDKVYKNIEVEEGYGEEDALSGKDPYSASKSATEMVVNAWRAVAEDKESRIILCSARAGNVIGGGDIAKDRLVPDLIRSFYQNTPAVIRNPNSLRPWQHVLDPINGYIKIGQRLMYKQSIATAYNFGPGDESKLNVESMAKIACSTWGGSSGYVIKSEPNQPSESVLLWLSSERANHDLGWKNALDAPTAIRWTIDWERESRATDALTAIDSQIIKYFEGAS
jgi:CDP-glucose 4,6-dehydratase